MWVRTPLRQGVLDTTLYVQVCVCATGQWFSPGIPVPSTKKTDCHNITENFVESGVKHHKPNHTVNDKKNC